jgi:transposase
MERDLLEGYLAEGLSLEQISKRVGKHPSTVGYWVRKHGFEPAGSAKFAPRGGLTREQLDPLIAGGMSCGEIAAQFGLNRSTVQYWLKKHGLQTERGRRRLHSQRARAAGQSTVEMDCRHHGRTTFWLEGRGYYRCLKCRWEAVARRRRKVKTILVTEAGGACRLCGYARCPEALQFHHLAPEEKQFGVSRGGITRSIARMRVEAAKCVLLCANCHAEVEAGVAALPEGGDASGVFGDQG